MVVTLLVCKTWSLLAKTAFLFHCPMGAHKEPFGVTNESTIEEALCAVVDTRNHPILIHCDKASIERVALSDACASFRMVLVSIFDEY